MESEALNPVGPWAALWRDRGLLLIALVVLGLLTMIAITALSPDHDLLREVTLKSERGIAFGDLPSLVRGERFRLDLRLGRSSSILVYLEDPEGAFSQVYPAAGEEPLLAGPEIHLPPVGEAWETGGLLRGNYYLWVFAAPRPFTAKEHESLQDRLKPPAGKDRRALRSFLRNLKLPGDVETVVQPFVVMERGDGGGRRAGRGPAGPEGGRRRPP